MFPVDRDYCLLSKLNTSAYNHLQKFLQFSNICWTQCDFDLPIVDIRISRWMLNVAEIKAQFRLGKHVRVLYVSG